MGSTTRARPRVRADGQRRHDADQTRTHETWERPRLVAARARPLHQGACRAREGVRAHPQPPGCAPPTVNRRLSALRPVFDCRLEHPGVDTHPSPPRPG
jgi:hypothetical protein